MRTQIRMIMPSGGSGSVPTVEETAARLDVRAALIKNSTVSADGFRTWDSETSAAPYEARIAAAANSED